jgi:hypothetical protein
MNFDRNIISKLHAVDPDKSLRLSRNLASLEENPWPHQAVAFRC